MKTPRPSTEFDRFANLAVRSDLISRNRLDELIAEFDLNDEFRQIEKRPASSDLSAFVTFLTDQDILTSWQCGKLREGKFKGFFLDQYRLLDHLRDDDRYNYFLALNTSSRERVVLRI